MFKFGGTIDKKIKEIVGNLPKGGRVLDLGSGLGANSIFLSEQGFKVVCLDKDEQVFKKIKEDYPKINVLSSDISDFVFSQNEYDLVLMLNVLHLFKFKEAARIISDAIGSLKKGGFLYLKAFSIKGPSYQKFASIAQKTKEKNTFYSNKTKSFTHFFSEDEFLKLFKGHEVLEMTDAVVEDNHPPLGKHEHGIFTVLIKKQ